MRNLYKLHNVNVLGKKILQWNYVKVLYALKRVFIFTHLIYKDGSSGTSATQNPKDSVG